MSTNKVSESQLRMFARLASDLTFKDWLDSELSSYLERLVEQTTPELFLRTQGSIKFIQRVRELMEVATAR